MSQPSSTSHSEATKTLVRRTQPGSSIHSYGSSYHPKGQLGYHPLEEGPDERSLLLSFAKEEDSGELLCLPAIVETSAYFSGRPTIFSAKNFNPIKDAKKIRRALREKGGHTDSRRIISLLSRRSAKQRVVISEAYVDVRGKEIEYDLTKGGYENFEVLVMLSLDSLPDTLAFAIYEFIKGLDTDEHLLIQAIVPYSNSIMREIADSYRKQFDADVIMDLFRNTRGDFRTILMAMLQGMRDENESVDMNEAGEDADVLYRACEVPLSPKAEVFTRILTQRSFERIKSTAQCYQKKYGLALEQSIKNSKLGGYKDTLIAIVRYATDKDDLLAEWFNRSMKESAMNDWALMQLTLGRSEIDLEDVKEAYRRKYGKPLINAIGNATSGDYKRLLMAFVGC